jgi:hypothetical protein
LTSAKAITSQEQYTKICSVFQIIRYYLSFMKSRLIMNVRKSYVGL